jgi:hypothetical protein
MADSEHHDLECSCRCSKGKVEFCSSCGARFSVTVQRTTTEIKLNIEALFPPELLLRDDGINQSDLIPASASHAKLVITYGGRIGHEFPITRKDTRIGRWDRSIESYPDIDLTVDDTDCYVSRKQAHIFYRDEKYFLEDLGSTNHTMLNKMELEPYSPREIKYDDSIILGKIFLIFSAMEDGN